MNLLRYKPLFRWAVPLAIILTLAAGAIVATRIVWAGDPSLGPNGRWITVYSFEYGYGTCAAGRTATLLDLEPGQPLTTENWYAFELPSGNSHMVCQFTIDDPSLLPEGTYSNFGWLCNIASNSTFVSKATVHPDGTLTVMCHSVGNGNAAIPAHTSGSYASPDSTASSSSNASSTSDATTNSGGENATDATTVSDGGEVVSDTSANTVDGAGATVEPQSPDNNNGAPPDHAGPQDNSNGNAPDHAGPQDNHDGIDKPNGNGNGNNGNGNGNGGG